MSAVIALRGVSKRFPGRQARPLPGIGALLRGDTTAHFAAEEIALHGIDLICNAGERIGIVGSNGAGKTTLLRIIAGLTTPSEGTVEVDGRVYAVMSMGGALRDDATGRENVYLDGELAERSDSDSAAIVDDVAEFTELGAFFDRPVRTYSSGMRARLAFALASIADPDVLILDEVLSVGDAAFNRKASQRMSRMAAKSKLMLVVSHGMGAIENMCERCIWIDQGTIRMDGPTEEVTAAYMEQVQRISEHSTWWKSAHRRTTPVLPEGNLLSQARLEAGGRAVTGAVSADDAVELVTEVAPGTAPETRTVELRIDRLDGLCIHQDRIADLSAVASQGSSSTLRLVMAPVGLAAGIYRAVITLVEDGRTRGYSELDFEVFVERVLIGGTPLAFHTGHVVTLDAGNGASGAGGAS